MKLKLPQYSPKSYILSGLIGALILWFLMGLINSRTMEVLPAIVQGFWQGLLLGGSPVWLGGLLRYIYNKFINKKPYLIVKVYNSHFEGVIKRFDDKMNIESRINQLKYSLNPEKVDLHYYSEKKNIKIDYNGGIETRTEIFTKLMNFFDTQIKFGEQ